MIITLGLYGVFLAIQTRRHPDYFTEVAGIRLSDEAAEAGEHGHLQIQSPFGANLQPLLQNQTEV